jgi:hypothetical protein
MDKNLVVVREILVYNQPKQKFYKFQTSTDKWTELADMIMKQPELEVRDINAMRAVVHSTQNTLELPNATIPEGAQKIFLFEAKVKSGAVNYDTMDFGSLRRLAKEKGVSQGLGANPTKASLVEALEGAAGISKKKEVKIGKTGKPRNKITKVESKETPSIKEADKKILEGQPTLEERVSSLEIGFANIIGAMYEACHDFVKPSIPVETPKVVTKISDDFDIDQLNKEAQGLKLK